MFAPWFDEVGARVGSRGDDGAGASAGAGVGASAGAGAGAGAGIGASAGAGGAGQGSASAVVSCEELTDALYKSFAIILKDNSAFDSADVSTARAWLVKAGCTPSAPPATR
jgi:hypothetical protein